MNIKGIFAEHNNQIVSFIQQPTAQNYRGHDFSSPFCYPATCTVSKVAIYDNWAFRMAADWSTLKWKQIPTKSQENASDLNMSASHNTPHTKIPSQPLRMRSNYSLFGYVVVTCSISTSFLKNVSVSVLTDSLLSCRKKEKKRKKKKSCLN